MSGIEIFLVILVIIIILTALGFTIYFVWRREKNKSNDNTGNGNGNGSGSGSGSGNGNGNTGIGGFTGLNPPPGGGSGPNQPGGGSGPNQPGGGSGPSPPPPLPPPSGPTGLIPLFFDYQGELQPGDQNPAIRTNNVTSLSACKAICMNNINCTILSWDSSRNFCDIYQTIVDARVQNQNPPTTNIVYSPNNRSNFVTWNNSTIYGADLVNGEVVANIPACIQKCNDVGSGGIFGTYITQYGVRGDGSIDCWCKGTNTNSGPNFELNWTTSAKATNLS